MSTSGGKAPRRRRTGRRGGDSGTREAILAAARRQFGDHGYTGATIRGIAAEAGVDAALVHHFYGSKERLFSAAVQLPVVPGEIVEAALAPGARAPGRSLGEHLLRTVLGAWDVAEVRSVFLGLLRSAVTSDEAAAMMREFVTEAILGRLAGAAGDPERPGHAGEAGEQSGQARKAGEQAPATGGQEPTAGLDGDADFRAALVASQVLGLALARYVLRIEPVAAAGHDQLAAAIGPTLQRYLSGDLGTAGGSGPGAARPSA